MKVLIVCFSGISNVASIVPLLDSLHRNYPQHQFTLLSRSFLSPLFASFERVEFVGADIRKKHKGVLGAFKLFNQLKNAKFDVVFDLQGSWRSQLIGYLFKLSGKRVHTLDKQKHETYRLIHRGADKYKPLKTIFDRYSEVFAKVGLKTDDEFAKLPSASMECRQKIVDVYGKKEGIWIGIAPLSIARGKTLPLRKTKNVIRHFDNQPNTKIFLFGAGDLENELLSDWQTIFKNVYAVHTSLRLDEELALMEQLDVMVSMDSGNMHLAALTATPVVSIWGATHPYAGFLGWKQTYDTCVGVNFSCRPCTAHEDKKCHFGDYRCLESIASENIIKKITYILEKKLIYGKNYCYR